MDTKRIATLGVLISMALMLSYFERMLPAIGPGIKLGLANVVVVIALYYLDIKAAFIISVVRVIVAGVLFGGISSIMYALSGALLAFFGMLTIKQFKCFSIIGVSVMGSTCHVTGQIIVAIYVVENIKLITYLPILLLSAIVTGISIGIVSYYTLLNMSYINKKDMGCM
ncbi:MAG: Gx transporter family protein [Lachnospirales bacterium]